MRSDFGQKHLKHVMTEAQPEPISTTMQYDKARGSPKMKRDMGAAQAISDAVPRGPKTDAPFK